MKLKHAHRQMDGWRLWLLHLVALMAISACGGSASNGPAPDTCGAVAFELRLRPMVAPPGYSSQAARGAIRCVEDGIATVTAAIINAQGSTVGTGRWPCASRQGSVTGIAAGSGYAVYVTAMDGTDRVLFRGERREVAVAAGQQTQLGVIELASTASNNAPQVQITSPADGFRRCMGLGITFAGTGQDVEDGDIRAALTWRSDVDGLLGTGPALPLDDLSLGPHIITLMAMDSGQATGMDTIQVVIHPPLLADTGQTASTGTGSDGDYTSHPPSFTANDDGTVTDNLTALLWQQSDDGVAVGYYAAMQSVAGIAIGPTDQWRLPAKKELLRIANYGRVNPALDTGIFQGTKNACYWTDTPCSGQGGYVWAVDFTTGRVFAAADSTACYIRAVSDYYRP
jgi:hypothetical protein